MKRPLRATLVVIAGLLVAAIAAFHHWRAQRQQAFHEVPAGGVADIVWVAVRQRDQHLFVRGLDRSKPILLFLPGGPGESFAPLAPVFTGELERDFVVAHIEMGGVGMSPDYASTPSFDDLVADTGTIIDALRERYGRDAVYLVGHSFGSALALRAAQAWPEKVLAVATVGQTVDWRAGNRLAHAELVRRATAERNRRALDELAAIPADLV
ncbi:MAG TPA: alpha/beta fold hydrolase, partial [Tahibacter sp.]|nr:alpha/beta fold hydrolase [Tahibacter sp.]